MKKIFISIIFFVMIFSLFACKKADDENVFIEKKKHNEDIEYILDQKFIICEKDLLKGEATIYVLKNQSEGQVLSIVIIDEHRQAIVFDGGRQEDADFLYNFLKEKSDSIYAWFLTHCHDDHVGALYQIIDKYKDSINIGNIYYKFPTFEWLYKLIGVDAGAVTLVENKIKEYSDYVKDKSIKFEVGSSYSSYKLGIIHNNIKKDDEIIFFSGICGITIKILNDMYMINNDPLNNSSIVYKVSIEHYDEYEKFLENDGQFKKVDRTIMTILGDLSYDGGEMLLKEKGDELKSDICVMAHHGQGGVWKDVYEIIKPDICIWPTTKKIYENKDGKYHTDEVKEWLKEIGVKKQYTTVDNSIIIK